VKQKTRGVRAIPFVLPKLYKLINNKLLAVQFSIFIVSGSSESLKKCTTEKYGLKRNGCLKEKV